ncbi:hypothetical protein MPDQ_000783 [Monascus purpureus]|uniref:Uncharacterized protein n=1 Tax=Monascus purpureus TaxID=5098 RepID=A0A507QT14_MONPU|nr:hypothetical protein MPDQ_000783 [Monascus purpureus]
MNSCASDRSSTGTSSVSGSPVGPADNRWSVRPPVEPWLEKCIEAAVSSLPTAPARLDAVKMVTQMLPYPRDSDSTTKLPFGNSIFCLLVQAMQDHTVGKLSYINITHAVPDHFTLSNLPASPSNSPRPQLAGGDGYFASPQVFSNAAVVSSYHDFRGPISNARTPHAPSPIVPPQSVQTAVLERYIPPSSLDEHRDFFTAGRPSHLIDRLFELSPDGGSLLLVYPTRNGVSTFQDQYLAPVIDPLIRQLVVVNGMSADLGQLLGSYSFAMGMDDMYGLQVNLQELCHALSTPESRFTLAAAESGNISLDRNLWGEWYIHQEKKRFKDVLSLNPNDGRRSPAGNTRRMFGTEPGMTSSMILTSILEGLRKRPYSTNYRPPGPIEVGVFVIRRSK